MSRDGGGVTIKKPVKVWNKPLETDFAVLFRALTSAAKGGVTGEWASLGSALADAASAVGFEKTPRRSVGS